MASAQLNQLVDNWTVQAVVASRYLLRLYRRLGDEKQAYVATQAGAPTEERARRLRLAARIPAVQTTFAQENAEEVQGEAQAWRNLVEAQAGICTFHSMVHGHSEKARSLQGPANATAKAFHRSVEGYRVAFPEPIAHEGITRALRAASERCAVACLEGLGGEESSEERLAVVLEIRKNIQEALLDAAGLGTPDVLSA